MSRRLKITLVAVTVVVAVVVLFTTVFPWVEQRLENPAIGVIWGGS